MVKYFCDMCECEKKETELYDIKIEKTEWEKDYRNYVICPSDYHYKRFNVCKKCRKKIMYMFKI